jgi:hypothetical protein
VLLVYGARKESVWSDHSYEASAYPTKQGITLQMPLTEGKKINNDRFLKQILLYAFVGNC